MTNTLAEIPYWLPAAVAFLGVVVWVMGNNRLDKTLKRMALVIFAGSLAISAVSYLLESDREQVERHTRALVQAVDEKKWEEMRSLLHPEVKVFAWTGPGQVVSAAEAVSGRFNLGSSRITTLSVEETGGTLTSRIQVVGGNAITNWDLEWEKVNETWLLFGVNFLGGPGMSSAGLEGFMALARPAVIALGHALGYIPPPAGPIWRGAVARARLLDCLAGPDATETYATSLLETAGEAWHIKKVREVPATAAIPTHSTSA